MLYKFIHKETDAQGGFDPWHVDLRNGKEKKVSKEKPLYKDWIADGNTPEVRDFVPPPADKRTPEQIRQYQYSIQISTPEVIEALMEHLKEGRSEKLDAIQAKRVQIKADFPL